MLLQKTVGMASHPDPDPVKVINMPEYVQAKLQPDVEGRLNTLCRF